MPITKWWSLPVEMECKATAGAPETVETLVVEGISSAAWMVATEEILATASIPGQSTALSTAAATG